MPELALLEAFPTFHLILLHAECCNSVKVKKKAKPQNMLIVAKDGDNEIHGHNVKFHCQLLLSGSPAHKSEGLVGLMSVIQETPPPN